MTLEEFRRLAETWGADLSRWPDAERAEAERIMGTPGATKILADAQRFDLLVQSVAPRISTQRAEKSAHAVMTRLAAGGAPQAWLRFDILRWLMPAAGFAGAAALGIVLGFAYPIDRPVAPNDARAVLSMILNSDSIVPDWMQQ